MQSNLRIFAPWLLLVVAASLLPFRAGFGNETASVFDDPSAIPAAGPRPAAVPAGAPAGARLPRVDPPNGPSKAEVTKLVKQIYEKEYGQKNPAGQRALANVLLTEADKVKINLTARFVLLQEAASAALSGGDVAACQKAIEGLDRSFKGDTTAMTVDAINKLAAVTTDETAILNFGFAAIARRIDQDDFQGARNLSKMMASKVYRSKDALARGRLKTLETVIADYDRARISLEKLKADPNDSAANFVAGKFFCFSKHDWTKGLPLLAKGTDIKLGNLAAKDLSNPADAKSRYELAEQWWELGQDKSHQVLQQHLRERAGYWYEKAVPELSGVQKVMAEKRLAEVAIPPDSPALVNVLKQMKTEGGDVTNLPDGTVRLNHGTLQLPTQVGVPFRVDTIVKTTSNMCSLRMLYAGGGFILNWEDNPNELQYHDPHNGNHGIKDKGNLPIDQFVHITWILTESGSQLLVDGEERAMFKGNHKDLAGYVAFNIWATPAIVIKAFSVAELPKDTVQK